MKLKKSVKKALIAIIVIISIILLIGISISIILYVKKQNRFEYTEHLDEIVVVVDGKNITLREFGYYISRIEDNVQKQALIYNPDNPAEWWNTHFSAGPDSQFVSDYAKSAAINLCIADEIYYQEAIRQGIVLDEYDVENANDNAAELINNMDSIQKNSIALDESVIGNMSKKQFLVYKYCENLINTIDLSMYNDDPHKLLNWDGSYYQEVILPSHTITVNEKLLDKITFGKITVNN